MPFALIIEITGLDEFMGVVPEYLWVLARPWIPLLGPVYLDFSLFVRL
jgi:hypothetical protein